MSAREQVLTQLAQEMRSSVDELPARVDALYKEVKKLKKELADAKKEGGPGLEELMKKVEERDGFNLLVAEIPGGPEAMREMSDQLLRHVPRLAVMLGSQMDGGKASLAATVSRDLLAEGFDAAKWIRSVSKLIQGGGGGRPDFAQAGGKDGSKLAEALEMAKTTVK